MTKVAFLVGLALMAAGGVAVVQGTPVQCHVDVDRGLPGPDGQEDCTPGTFQQLTRAQACRHKVRPRLSPEDRREILTEYDVPGWTGRDGEIDHLIPHFLGGDTAPPNLWPEPGVIPNEKDKLEFYVYDRVCHSKPSPMSLRTAYKIFATDWRKYYWLYGVDRVDSKAK